MSFEGVPGPNTGVDRFVAAVRAARDLLLIGVGVTVMVSSPKSLEDFGLSAPGVKVWATCVLVGAIGALGSGMAGRLILEIWACCLVSGALLFWAVALVWRPDTSVTSWSIALLALSVIAGEVVRIADTVGERQATR